MIVVNGRSREKTVLFSSRGWVAHLFRSGGVDSLSPHRFVSPTAEAIGHPSLAHGIRGNGLSMGMNHQIELPERVVREKKEEVWSVITQPDADAGKREYQRLLRTIGHPAAIVRARLVPGTRRLQYTLNALIVLGRILLICYPTCIVGAVLYSWWIIILCPVVFVGDFLMNRAQTHVNVELAARLFVLDELMEVDEEFGTS